MNTIKKIRMEKEMTQSELARVVGVSSPFIHDLENGNRNAKPATLRKIAEALGCTVEALKGGQPNGTTP